MTNYTPPVCEDANQLNHVIVDIDGQVFPIDGALLTEPTLVHECQELRSNAIHVGFRNWQNSLGIPSDYHEAFIELVTSEPRNRTAFFIAGIPTPFENAFDATLALHLDDDINRVGRAQELAIGLARALYPENPTDSARLILDWLRRNGRTSRTHRQLVTAIAGGGGTQSGRVKPQDAARNILDYFQQQVLGEDEAPSTPPLRYFRGDYYRWNGQTWEPIADIRPLVVLAMQALHNNLNITRQFVGSVIDNIQAIVNFPVTKVATPIYVVSESPLRVESRNAIAFTNNLVEIDECTAIASSTVSDARMFLPVTVNYAFDPLAACPLWLQTINEVLPPRSESDRRREVLQEMFGCTLLRGRHDLEKMFILIGNGANGKSLVANVLTEMLGQQNVSSVALESLTDNFLIATMDGMSANIVNDMHRMPKVQEGLLKQLVSGQLTQVNRKHRDPYVMKPTAKLIYASNYLPPFSDPTGGTWRRLCVIPFLETFGQQNRDVHRFRNLCSELPGIFNWSIQGAQRLLRQEFLTSCVVCDDAVNEHRHDSSPVAQFLDECCILGQDCEETSARLYTIYLGFCRSIGRHPKSTSEFGKELKQCGVENRVRLTQGSSRPWGYRGVALRSECVTYDRISAEIKFNPQTFQQRDTFGPTERNE